MDEQVEIKMTEEETDLLVRSFVEVALLDVSKAQFDESMQSTGDIKEALYAAVVNEMANIALAYHIKNIEENE